MCFWFYCVGDRHQPQLRRQFFLKSATERAGSAGRTYRPKKCDLSLRMHIFAPNLRPGLPTGQNLRPALFLQIFQHFFWVCRKLLSGFPSLCLCPFGPVSDLLHSTKREYFPLRLYYPPLFVDESLLFQKSEFPEFQPLYFSDLIPPFQIPLDQLFSLSKPPHIVFFGFISKAAALSLLFFADLLLFSSNLASTHLLFSTPLFSRFTL